MTSTILYSCPYIPAEWISAHRLQPCRVLPVSASGAPGWAQGAGVCPYVAGFFARAEGEAQAAAIIATTLCDQMRRALELLHRQDDCPSFLFNLPSTWQHPGVQALYQAEVERLGRFLVRLGGTAPSREELAGVMSGYDRARATIRARQPLLSAREYVTLLADYHEHPPTFKGTKLRQCRRSTSPPSPLPSREGGASWRDHDTVWNSQQSVLPLPSRGGGWGERLSAGTAINWRICGRVGDTSATTLQRPGIPLALVGVPMMRDSFSLFDLIDAAGGRVVLTATENGELTLPDRFDPARLAEDPLAELTRSYFAHIPHAFRRPNDQLYHWLARMLEERHAAGIIFLRYRWCDLWQAELQRLKEWTALPVLDIDLGWEDGLTPRTAMRLQAFLEILA